MLNAQIMARKIKKHSYNFFLNKTVQYSLKKNATVYTIGLENPWHKRNSHGFEM
jgi:hypothetical protein